MMETFLTSIGLILVMCLVECDESMYDQTSMLFNKKAFRERAVQLMDMKVSFRVLSVRLSNLDFYLNILSAEEGHTLRIMITNWLLTEMAGNDVLFYQVEENRLAFFILKDYEETEKRLLQRLDERMRKPWNIGKYQVRLQAVVLPLEIPKDAKSPSQLYQLFDLEENGSRSAVTILTGEQKEEMENSIEIEKCVRRNLDGNNIQVYYQPIWDADSRSIVACEALMRVFDQQLGFVRPDRIVGLAEKNGTISEIDRMVLEKVCRFIRDNKPQKYGLRYIEVNMSMYEMFTPDVVGTYKDILSKYGVPIDMINIEFTETLNNSDSEVFAKTKKELSEAGFTLSIDDFGTEFSNMGRLFSNDFMNVKVDKSLLWAADKDEYTRSFLGSLMEMLRKMGFNALQEGVETREQLDFVTAHGCNLIQGFYFSKPIPQDDFLNYLREFNARE